MKKRILSLLLVLCMIVALLPVTASAASAKYYTVEQYDENGNGTMLIAPTEASWTGSNYAGATAFCQALLGSDNVTVSNDAVTGIQINGTWLNDEGTSQWYIATNYEKKVYRDLGYFYFSDADVYRFIYVTNGNFSNADMTTDGLDWDNAAYMNVEKADLIKTLSAYNGVTLGTNRKAAYDAGIAAIVNIDATDDDVAAAKTNMETAEDAAGSITLNKETTELYVGQKETLTATLEPAGSTDVLTWTSDDENVVTVEDGVLKGMSAGTATVTVEAGELGLTDTIEVTVNALQGLFITKLNSNASSTIEAKKEELLLTAFAEPDNLENLDWQWSVEDSSIAKVTPMEGNEYLATVSGKAEGTTNVVVTLGSMTSTFEVTVTPYTGSYVYFDFDDETKEDLPLDENNTITLTSLDAGCFKVANTSGSVTWNCKGYVTIWHPDYGDVQQYHTWINSETGRWASSGTQPPTATVDTSDGFTQTFTIIDQDLSNITELKIYVNGTEVSTENPFVMTGTGRANVRTDALIDGEWITIPQQALEYTTSDSTGNIRILGNELILNRAGEATLTATVLGSDVSASFKARCEYVAVESMEVIVPETAYMHDYNTYTGHFVGLLPETGFQVKFTPSNATNRDYNFEALTPDVAIYWKEHNNGIVPMKPGTAKFKVSSADNENIYQEISINFEYKNKLTAATVEDFTMAPGQKMDLPITVTPGNASEQRFTWTCEPSGIVGVESSIATDAGGTSHWFTHQISAWSVGTVVVTGTPVDSTGGCDPVTFTVTVTSDSEIPDSDDTMKTVKDDIAHGLAYLAENGLNAYKKEWNIFTTVRAGGSIGQENMDAYCASVKAQLDSGESMQPTDYARIVFTLTALGVDPTSFMGHNVVEKLYNNPTDMSAYASNMVCWTLIALDTHDYEIPADAKWTREAMITRLLAFQTGDGSFGLNTSDSTGSVDMTGMILQSLAPYMDRTDVQAAFANAQVYLKNKLTLNAGYVEGGSENSCTAAQVVVALCAAGIDPLDSANGYTRGGDNLITNLHKFRIASGGFKTWEAVDEADLLGTYQTTYALVAYQRFVESKTSLYDLTDVTLEAVEPVGPADPAEITVTISNAGTLVMAQKTVTVTDRNEDGTLDVDEALYATHEAGFEGGATAGYLADPSGMVTRLWGINTTGTGYWLNDASCSGLKDAVKAGDNLVAWIYKDTTSWSDAYVKWGSTSASATTGTALTVSLQKAGYDSNWNTVFSALTGATIKAFGLDLTEKDVCTVTDNGDGTYAVTFNSAGEYYLVATSDSTILVPTVCKVTVAQGAATTIPGDLNGDKLVDGDDVMYVYTLITSGTTLTEEQVAQLDITEDGWVDGDDVMAIYLLTLK